MHGAVSERTDSNSCEFGNRCAFPSGLMTRRENVQAVLLEDDC